MGKRILMIVGDYAEDYEVIREGDPGAWGVPPGGFVIQHRDPRPGRNPER
jgi:hypothetical protein